MIVATKIANVHTLPELRKHTAQGSDLVRGNGSHHSAILQLEILTALARKSRISITGWHPYHDARMQNESEMC